MQTEPTSRHCRYIAVDFVGVHGQGLTRPHLYTNTRLVFGTCVVSVLVFKTSLALPIPSTVPYPVTSIHILRFQVLTR